MRPGEAMALRWSEVDTRKRSARVCRLRIYGKIQERTKTKVVREVLLNDRALHALDKARPLTELRSDYVFAPEGNGDRAELFIRSETGPKRYWLSAMRKVGIRRRRMYDTRHTYATMCLNVRHESGIHCRATWAQRAGIVVDLCEVDQLAERLGRA